MALLLLSSLALRSFSFPFPNPPPLPPSSNLITASAKILAYALLAVERYFSAFCLASSSAVGAATALGADVVEAKEELVVLLRFRRPRSEPRKDDGLDISGGLPVLVGVVVGVMVLGLDGDGNSSAAEMESDLCEEVDLLG